MVSLLELQRKILKLKNQRNQLIEKRLDGRSQKWLCEKTGLSAMNMSNNLNADFTEDQMELIDNILGQAVTNGHEF